MNQQPSSAREAATAEFYVGQRVVMTAAAIEQGLDGVRVKHTTGVVVGLNPRRPILPAEIEALQPKRIRVRRDGLKSVETWGAKFWQPETITKE